MTPLGATPGGLKLPLRAFEPQMSPPYDSALIQILSLLFLDASSHLYNRGCPSVGPSVGPSVRPSVGGLVTLLSKTGKSMILIANNDASCITSSYNHFIVMRMHRWPYGACLRSFLCSYLVRHVGFFRSCRVGVSGRQVGSSDIAKPTWHLFDSLMDNFPT